MTKTQQLNLTLNYIEIIFPKQALLMLGKLQWLPCKSNVIETLIKIPLNHPLNIIE